MSVLIERQPVTNSRWASERWKVRGVVAGEELARRHPRRTLIREDEHGAQYLWTGFRVELFKDDAESYYQNLMGEKPSVFVICRVSEEDDEEGKRPLVPFLTTLSYAEASAYMETDDPVFAVPIPPEIYRWVERYVLANFVPEAKRKRNRKRWVEKDGRG